MKYIIILGEEYWFEQQSNPKLFVEASYLLERLKKRRDRRFEYIILSNPHQLLNTISKIGNENIRGLFLFQDVLSDANLNGFTIFEMKKYLYNLKNNGIYIYPPIKKSTFLQKVEPKI